MNALDTARARYRANSVRWGYIWALWCAVLWGIWYIPGTALWSEAPYSTMSFDTTGELLLSAAVITAFSAVSVLIFLFIWLAVLEKFGEFRRTVKRFSSISKWYFLAAIFGGPCALFGAYLAIGFVGPIFAAVASLLYPIVGATLARLWYNEIITQRAAIGIGLIVTSGIAIFLPGLFSESAGAGDTAWIGYLGGAVSAIGWGFEGAIVGRALDVSDADVGITIRFTAEVLFWVFLILPAAVIFFDAPVIPVALATFNFWAIIWVLLAGLSYGFSYVAWYKSFPLIGVGRGQAIAALHTVFAVVFLAVFAFQFPSWNFLVGLALAVAGTFLMVSEDSKVVEVVRQPPAKELTARTRRNKTACVSKGGLHMKGYILRLLMEAGESGVWDYEIMTSVFAEYGYSGSYWKGEVRATLTDLYSGALIEEIEDDLDDGGSFGIGKILIKFRISAFGTQRIAETGLI